MEHQQRKNKSVSVAETAKLSDAKIAKLKKLSKKLKETNQRGSIMMPCTYHY